MKKDNEELKPIIDQLIINNMMNLVHIKTLTSAFHELANQVLDESESKAFLEGLYDTLSEKTLSGLNEISGSLYNPAKAHFEAMDFQSYIRYVRENLK